MMSGERGAGRHRRPTTLAAAVAVSLLISGCTGSGDDSPVTDRASPSVGSTKETEGIPRPPGHEGLWFGTEPKLPLDHLVWASQRYVGDPVVVPAVGDRAKGPEAKDLPDVCDPRVVDRLVELGLRAGAEPDGGYKYVQCSVLGEFGDRDLGGMHFYWGSAADVSMLSDRGTDGAPDDSGTETLSTGEISDQFGCVGIRRTLSENGAVFAYFGNIADYSNCNDATKIVQIVFNTLGGNLVQL